MYKDFSFLSKTVLPSKEIMLELTQKMSLILAAEKTVYRPLTDIGTPGSLITFSDEKSVSKARDVIIIPDLHGRCDFLLNILSFKLDQNSVLDLLAQDKIHLVFLGDALHTEGTSKERWEEAYKAYLEKDYASIPMVREMEKGLSLLCALYQLKIMFPKNFFYLKGNHENIKNKLENGDFPFKKYACEGDMTFRFMKTVYGQEVLDEMELVEDRLPLVYTAQNLFVSHAEPERRFSRDSIIHGAFIEAVKRGLTWTDNGKAEKGSVAGCMEELGCRWESEKNALWVSGHRAVKGAYSFSEDGLFLQIHKINVQKVLLVKKGEKVNIENALIDVNVGGDVNGK